MKLITALHKSAALIIGMVCITPMLLSGCGGSGGSSAGGTTLSSIAITPDTATFPNGQSQKLTATGTYSDGATADISSQVSWKSADTGVATVDSSTGIATGVAIGSTTVSASSGGITSPGANLRVTVAAPAGVMAVSASGQVTLSWSAVTGAASYNIYWGTAPAITAASSKISGATSPYLHSPLLDGNTYYYRVAAANAADETLSAETFSFLYAGGNPAGTFAPAAGRLINARVGHNATLLANGNVLVTSGWNGTIYLTDSELYDTATATFSATGSLLTQRAYSSATLLPNGRVLVIGGHNLTGSLSSAELYNPATGQFTATGGLTTARETHTATLLANGKVLVTGGWGGAANLASAELYDPATGSFSATGSMITARAKHVATLLPNGKVLLTGGCSTINCVGGELATAEVYDPATGIFTATGSFMYARHNHTATLMPDGRVVLIGGQNFDGVWPGRTETYNPADGTFSSSAIMVNAGSYHSALLLSNGKVIVMPCGCGDAPTGAHLYDPATDSFSLTGTSNGLQHQNSVLLPNGKILLTGGQTAEALPVISSNAELFQ